MEIKNTLLTNINFTAKTKEEDCISDITKNFSRRYSLIDIINDLNRNQNLKMTSSSTYKIGEDYDVILGPTHGLADILKNLKEIKKSGITCAPQLIKNSKSATEHYSIIIVKHPKTNRKNPIFSENQNNVSSTNKAKFVDELVRFHRETQMYNPSILDNPELIIVTDNDELYMTEWNSLKKFSSETQKKQWFNQLRKLLNLEKTN